MKKFLIGIIKIYQKIPGRFHDSCRHIPTCSNYAIEALEVHGVRKGGWLATKRVLKCNPWGTHGIDLVPEKKEDDK